MLLLLLFLFIGNYIFKLLNTEFPQLNDSILQFSICKFIVQEVVKSCGIHNERMEIIYTKEKKIVQNFAERRHYLRNYIFCIHLR